VDAGGKCLAPGLIDIRVKTGEPGAEPKETLKSASLSAAAGGVSTIVIQPDTDPGRRRPGHDRLHPAARRGPEPRQRARVAGAATNRDGQRMAEIGLMDEAGALYFTDVDKVIANSRTLQRVMSYAAAFNALIACRPADPWLSEGAVATSGELATRLGLSAAPAIAERIQLERDLGAGRTDRRALPGRPDLDRGRARDAGAGSGEGAGGRRLGLDQPPVLQRDRHRRLPDLLPAGPAAAPESDRQALIEAVRDGLIDVITSAHAPAPAEDKRRPFGEAAPGAVGLETLLSAALMLHHEDGLDLLDILRPLTHGPASLLGLESGVLAEGAPADLVLFDPMPRSSSTPRS
jgi:dihydroorotase